MKSAYVALCTLLLAVAAVMISTPAASAAIINGAITAGVNTLNDRNAERHIDANGNSIVDIGESIEAVLIVEDLSNLDFGGTPLDRIFEADYQMTAHSLLTVTDIIDPSPGNPNALVTYVLRGGFDDGSALRLYEDDEALAGTILLDFSSQSADVAVTLATDGSHILSLDLSGDFDQWIAVGPKSLALLSQSGGIEMQSNAGLTVSADPMNLPYAPGSTFTAAFGTTHDMVVFGSIFQAAPSVMNRGWDAQSNMSLQFESSIPEPTAALLLACGGMFMVTCSPRRNRRIA